MEADRADFLRLWQEYLTFYHVTLTPRVTDSTWTRLLDPTSPLKARVVPGDAGLLGFAIHLHHPSTWVMGDDCYLEDLFIDASARGKGLGRELIEDLIALARTKGWHRLYWHTDAGNVPARRLYDRFIASDGHIRYRLPLS